MPSIPWEQVKEVVDAVLDLPPDKRAPYLDQACPQPTVRLYVESLVLSYEQAGDFLNEPAAVLHSKPVAEVEPDSWKGRRIGPYQVVERIGEGGMGAVYRALRADDQYKKEVAIKLVRSGFDTRFAQARFKAERQILANLDHPNIAHLLDGGSTEDGQPYFVMEYIQGQPLDKYCDDHRLTVSQRLGLFRMVCSAVQYAHQNLVIHRDIKPGNILVTEEGVPKLLDFGIAKILAPEDGDSADLRTMTMERRLTPEYASPEQLRGETITTASDVYSLGVVLYELLTGRRPYILLSRRPEDITRAMSETEPEKPSAAITRVKEPGVSTGARSNWKPETVSSTREGSPERLRRRLSGDLDNIVLMALRKEPQRRYASAEQFSEDLRRHLEGLPVAARTDTFGYRSGKFIRRHSLGVVAAVLVVLSLTAGLAVALREATIARTERARAEHRFNDVRSLAKSLLFEIYDSIKELPGSTQARQSLVTNALKYLDSLAGEARGDPSLQRELADAYERVGDVQGEPFTASLGDNAGALESYLKAQAIRKTLAAAGRTQDRIKYAANCRSVSAVQQQTSNAAGAISSAQESVTTTQAVLKTEPANEDALKELAADYQVLGTMLDESHLGANGGQDAAAGNYQKALEIDEKLTQNSTDRVRLRSLAVDEFQIGKHLQNAGYRTEALEAFHKALAIADGLAANPNDTQAKWDVVAVTNGLGDTFLMNGDAAHALANYQRALLLDMTISAADPNNEVAREGLGEGNLNFGMSLVKLGRRDEAMKHLARAISILEKEAELNPQQQGANWDLGIAYVWAASITPDLTAALAGYQKALAIAQRLEKVDTGTSDWQENEAEVRVQLGDFLQRHGEFDRAAENYRQALAIAEPIVASHGDRQEARYALAGAYFGLGQIASRQAQMPSQPLDKQARKWNEAKSWYQRSSDAWRQVRHPAAVSPNGFDCLHPDEAGRQLALANAALASLHKP